MTTQRTTTTTQRSTTTTTTRRAWTTKSPFYNPSNPSYGGGGSYFGDRFGDDSIFGGGSSSRTTTTKKPSSSGSSFLSGFSSFLSGDGGKILQGILGTRGGSGSNSGGGGFGSFFGDSTRPLQENKNYRGGLFSENSNTNQQGSQQHSNNDYSRYPVTRQGEASPSSQSSSPSASHGSYGWKLS